MSAHDRSSADSRVICDRLLVLVQQEAEDTKASSNNNLNDYDDYDMPRECLALAYRLRRSLSVSGLI